MTKFLKFLSIFLAYAIFSCSNGVKTNNNAVKDFKIEKYLGKWYEIARYDHSFERGCENVSANYSLKENNKIKIVNKCIKNDKEKIAKATGYFLKSKDIAHLKVTFFWPFYGNYKVIYIDKNYENAIIDGGTYDYFWILSRNKNPDQRILEFLIKKAQIFGYKKEQMIFAKYN